MCYKWKKNINIRYYKWDNKRLIVNEKYMRTICPNLAMFNINCIGKIIYTDIHFLENLCTIVKGNSFNDKEKLAFRILIDYLFKKYYGFQNDLLEFFEDYYGNKKY